MKFTMITQKRRAGSKAKPSTSGSMATSPNADAPKRKSHKKVKFHKSIGQIR